MSFFAPTTAKNIKRRQSFKSEMSWAAMTGPSPIVSQICWAGCISFSSHFQHFNWLYVLFQIFSSQLYTVLEREKLMAIYVQINIHNIYFQPKKSGFSTFSWYKFGTAASSFHPSPSYQTEDTNLRFNSYFLLFREPGRYHIYIYMFLKNIEFMTVERCKLIR